MAPALSTTDVCPYRASHPALRVRLLKVLPAAIARDALSRSHRSATAHDRPPPAELFVPPAPTAPTQRRGAHTLSCHARTHTHAHARTHMRKDACRWNGQTHSHNHTNARMHSHARKRMRARTRTCARTQTRAHKCAQTRTQTHTSAWTLPHTRARARTAPRAQTRTDSEARGHSHTRTRTHSRGPHALKTLLGEQFE